MLGYHYRCRGVPGRYRRAADRVVLACLLVNRPYMHESVPVCAQRQVIPHALMFLSCRILCSARLLLAVEHGAPPASASPSSGPHFGAGPAVRAAPDSRLAGRGSGAEFSNAFSPLKLGIELAGVLDRRLEFPAGIGQATRGPSFVKTSSGPRRLLMGTKAGNHFETQPLRSSNSPPPPPLHGKT